MYYRIRNITVRQLLSHQVGLFAFEELGDRNLVADLDRLAVVLARQRPAWEPGTRQAYHAITLGYYENELLRRIDPQYRSLGQFFHDEVAAPLGLDFYIRLPEDIPDSRLATLARPSLLAMLRGFGIGFFLTAFNRRSNISRALVGSMFPHDPQRIYARNLEMPSGGGVGTARANDRAYSVFATDGPELQLRPGTLRLLAAPAVRPTRGFYDECMMGDGVQFSSTDLLGPVGPRIMEVMRSQRRELCRKEMVTKPGLPNNGRASFCGGCAFEKHGKQ